MSNTICVKVYDRISYYPFKWSDERLFAFIDGLWQRVEKTDRKNKYNEYIFQVI